MVSPMSKARQLAQKPSQPTGRKNLIINGAMQVAQRGEQTNLSYANGSQSYGECDRFIFYSESGTSHVATLKQVEDGTDSETTPAGFPNALKVDVTTADSTITGTQSARIIQKLEGQDLMHLKYGSSDARSITLSFWVKSSTTGTYTFNIYTEPHGRLIGHTYTINTADTWEYKTLTLAGDTESGADLDNDNTTAFWCQWFLASGPDQQSGTFATSWQDYTAADYVKTGQPNVMSSTSNDWYLTGVQLEVGSTATEFEHRSYGEELLLCQRYYYQYDNTTEVRYVGGATGRSTTTAYGMGQSHPTPMRANPVVYDDGLAVYRGDVARLVSASNAAAGVNNWVMNPTFASDSGCTDGSALMIYVNQTPSYLRFDAEL